MISLNIKNEKALRANSLSPSRKYLRFILLRINKDTYNIIYQLVFRAQSISLLLGLDFVRMHFL